MATGPDPKPPAAAALSLTTLGTWSLWSAAPPEAPVAVLGPSKPLALFVYLALAPGRAVRRELLLDLLWADLEPTAALHALRQTLWLLRQRLGDTLQASPGGEVRLVAPVAVDRDDFLAAVEGRDRDRAIALYKGDFVPGFAAPGGADFERWADLERDRLRGIFRGVGAEQVRRLLDASHFNDAVALARRVRDSDRGHEIGWRLLIEALCAAGASLRATVEADALERLLREENREPEPATRAAIRLARQASSAEAAPDAAGGRRGAGGLVTELVGREREFSAILRAWEASRTGASRHVHITAPPGLGKTRLLTDVYRRLRSGGAQALLLRAHPGERQVAYALAGDLASALGTLPGAAAVSPAAAAALVSLSPTLSTRYPFASPDGALGEEALRRRTIALAELVDAIADEAPLALLVDDVHWGDAASHQVLNGIAARLESARVLLVTTTRPSPEGLVGREGTEQLGLQPLTPLDIGDIVGGLGTLPQERWATDFPARLELATHGSPLLVVETLQLLLERGILTLGEDGWRCADPDGVAAALSEGSAVRQRLAQLDRDQRWLLLVLAVAGSPVSTAQFVAHAERGSDALLADLAVLEQRGFLVRSGDGWTPAHDEVAEAAIDAAAPEALRAAYLATGRAAASDAPDDPAILLRAGHFLAQAGAWGELGRVFSRWFRLQRRRGDHRAARELALEFAGPGGQVVDAEALLRLLPALVRWGPGATGTRVVVGAALVAASALAVFHVTRSRTPPPPDEEFIAITRSPDGRAFRAYRVPVSADRWDESRPLDAATAGEPYDPVRKPADWEEWAVYSSARDAWAVTRVLPGRDAQDLFLVRADGRETRLTESPGDDNDPSWAPDGSRLAFATARWSDRGWTHIAVIDPDAPGPVVQLTRGDASDGRPRWSFRGARIAFLRRYPAAPPPGRPTELCWVTLEAHDPVCRDLQGGFLISALSKWTNATHVGAIVDSAGLLSLASIGIDDGSVTVIRRNMAAGAVSPDGQWALGIVGDASDEAGDWIVFPVSRPDRATTVVVGGESKEFVLRWGRVQRPGTYVDRIVIEPSARHVALGSPHRLQARGVTALGDTVALTAARWWSSDTTVAEVDESGLVDARRRGHAWVHVTAGGWRSDSTALLVTSDVPTTVVRDEWRGTADTAWVRFGTPRPQVTRGPDGVPGLWSRGDGSFASGVYTRRAFSASDGIGVEVRLSSPITTTQWQTLVVALDGDVDDDSLPHWDHRTGPLPRRGAVGGRSDFCEVDVPAAEGTEGMDRMGLVMAQGTAQRALPPETRTGRWYMVRVQIFPDGRCGVAVDGHAVWIGRRPVRTHRPFRVVLSGNSVGTRMLFGPVEVWQGMKNGIDWSVATRRAAAPTARQRR